MLLDASTATVHRQLNSLSNQGLLTTEHDFFAELARCMMQASRS